MAGVQKCQSCGGNIYAEHIDQGRAGRWAGQMLCPICYAGETRPEAGRRCRGPHGRYAPAAADRGPGIERGRADLAGRLHGRGRGVANPGRRHEDSPAANVFKRPTTMTGQGATRVRTFHSKIQAESIEFMDTAINEWLDENPDVEVKFVSSTIGVMAGKFPEPNIILSVWY